MRYKVLLVNVVYFFDSDGRDISEVYRVLRSGGRLVIYVTSRDTMQKWPFAGPNTHRTFDAHDLTNLLVSAGFSRSHIIITNAELALGVKGLMLTAGPRTAKSLAPSSAPHRPDVGSRSRRKSGGSIGIGKLGRGQPSLQRRLDVSRLANAGRYEPSSDEFIRDFILGRLPADIRSTPCVLLSSRGRARVRQSRQSKVSKLPRLDPKTKLPNG
jgi:SAM-dependent methyltransferase